MNVNETNEIAAKMYLNLKNLGIIKEEFSDILYIAMIAVLSKKSIEHLVPITIETDQGRSGRAVFGTNETDANERMRLFVQLLKEIEQSPQDIVHVEVTDKYINIVILKDSEYKELKNHITDSQCKNYFQKWCEQLQLHTI